MDVTDHPPTPAVFSMSMTHDDAISSSDGPGEDPLAGVTLLFVYNADSGVMATLKDYVHKTVSPKTYQCNLCALTFGGMGMKDTWAEFIDGLQMPVEFLHRDELLSRHGVRDAYLPAVLTLEGSSVEEFISADEMNALGTLDELKRLVQTKVTQLRQLRSLS